MIVYIIVIYMNYSSCKIIFFLSEKRKKKQEFAFFTRVFAQKLQEKRFMIPKNAKR